MHNPCLWNIINTMDFVARFKQIALVIGDALLFYASLAITLLIRYGSPSKEIVNLHLNPFTIVFIVWFLTAYIAGLYDLKTLKNDQNFIRTLITAAITTGTIAIILFYLIPGFVITPKTNLLIFVALFGLSLYIWRTIFNTFLAAGQPIHRVLLIGYNKTAEELANHLKNNPQFGYEITFWMKEGLDDKEFDHLAQIIIANKINVIAVPAHIKKKSKAARLIYKTISLGIEATELSELYEKIFQKVPLAELEETWVLEHITRNRRVYNILKRPVEILLSILLLILFLPVWIIAIIMIRMTSKGPAIFKQKRIGWRGKEFIIKKFRTMYENAEKNGPRWAQYRDDRATPIGRFLRKTHLDEIPQLINVLSGDLALVGPRPERPEFVEQLRKEIPFYDLRHLVRPGITGWSQINYKYGASVEDAYEKLQYELYYLKHRSLIMDLIILVRTAKLFFVTLR